MNDRDRYIAHHTQPSPLKDPQSQPTTHHRSITPNHNPATCSRQRQRGSYRGHTNPCSNSNACSTQKPSSIATAADDPRVSRADSKTHPGCLRGEPSRCKQRRGVDLTIGRYVQTSRRPQNPPSSSRNRDSFSAFSFSSPVSVCIGGQSVGHHIICWSTRRSNWRLRLLTAGRSFIATPSKPPVSMSPAAWSGRQVVFEVMIFPHHHLQGCRTLTILGIYNSSTIELAYVGRISFATTEELFPPFLDR